MIEALLNFHITKLNALITLIPLSTSPILTKPNSIPSSPQSRSACSHHSSDGERFAGCSLSESVVAIVAVGRSGHALKEQ